MSIQCRCTYLGCLDLGAVSLSSVVQLGDNANTKLTSRALAVQRAVPDFYGDEFRFASYSIFFKPKLTLQPSVNVAFQSRSPLQNIQVGAVESLGVSASSYLRVGCGGPLSAVSRVKNIRHFNNRDIS
ncbi:spore germination protein GerPE [Cohnella sp.]|uniref:spore germination protein GerPE n=1 Tax=Cohnella sp. TaxID=1883426 RepID=UPI003567C095